MNLDQLTPVAGPAAALGLATMDGTDILDVWYPKPVLGQAPADVPNLDAGTKGDDIRGVTVTTVRTVIDDLAAPPVDAADAYLRLHLLSHRLVKPRTINLDGIFGKLPLVAWTNLGPVPTARFNDVQLRARSKGVHLTVLGVDRFPRMVDYVVPEGVRVADADRVRLGAYVASGTVVMHEGFINFNAGTLGTSMVEGRISAGVVVGDGSDIGGGASIMGTLSGGGYRGDQYRPRLLDRGKRWCGYFARRRERGRSGVLHHRRIQGHASRWCCGEGPRTLRSPRVALPAQLPIRRARGGAARRKLGRPELRPPLQ